MEKYHQHYISLRHFHLRKFLHNRYNDLLVADTFRQIALSMITLFVPIYLLKLGFPLITIVFFELIMLAFSFPVHIIVMKYISIWGVKNTIITSYIINIIFYLILYNTNYFLDYFSPYIFLGLVGLFNVISISVFWTAHHVYFLRTTRVKDSGRKDGLVNSVPVIFGIVGPFLGSILITRFSFHFAFLASTLLLIIASGALFFSTNIKIKTQKLDLRRIIDIKHTTKNLIYIMQGVNFTAAGFAWPLFMFFMSLKLTTIGFLYLIANIANSVVCYTAGQQSDKQGSRTIARWGAVGHGLSLIFRSFAATATTMSIWLTFGGLTSGLMFVPLEAAFHRTSHRDMANAVLNREFHLHIGRIFIFVLFMVMLLLAPIKQAFMTVLIVGGICTISLNWIIKKDNVIIS